MPLFMNSLTVATDSALTGISARAIAIRASSPDSGYAFACAAKYLRLSRLMERLFSIRALASAIFALLSASPAALSACRTVAVADWVCAAFLSSMSCSISSSADVRPAFAAASAVPEDAAVPAPVFAAAVVCAWVGENILLNMLMLVIVKASLCAWRSECKVLLALLAISAKREIILTFIHKNEIS